MDTISEKKQRSLDAKAEPLAEAMVRQHAALFSALVDLAPVGVYVVDSRFRLQQINSRAMPAFAHVQPSIGRDFGEVMSLLWGKELGAQVSAIFRHTMHAGRISVESEGRNQGAVFTIELPVATKASSGQKMDRRPAMRNVFESSNEADSPIFILLVEDHELTRVVLAQMLTRRNYKVITADSVAQARKAAREHPFELLISDIGLPDGNGNDLMSELRVTYGMKGIALTGYGMEEDIARGKAAGFVTHLTKPVRIQSLENALQVVRRAD